MSNCTRQINNDLARTQKEAIVTWDNILVILPKQLRKTTNQSHHYLRVAFKPHAPSRSVKLITRWFKYDRDKL
jgi:hypothetical protein